MLITVKELTRYWNVFPKGVLHIGAHDAEESEQYNLANWGAVAWIEAQPDKAETLRAKFNDTKDTVIEAAVWSKSGIPLNLNVMSSSASTSLLELGTHVEAHPEISLSHSIKVTTKTLEEIVPDGSTADFMCVDIQGAELEAIKGFSSRLNQIKWIYTEVNREELYKNCCLVEELDDYLRGHGFKRVATRWTEFGWGDALYQATHIRNEVSRFRVYAWHILNTIHFTKRMILHKFNS